MKNKIYAITLLFLSTIIFSCESDDLDYQNDFKSSQNAWLKFKELTNNSYKYTAVSGSWIGLSWETTIKVFNGKIIERHFKYIMTDGLPEDFPEEELEWTENENEIGSHKYSGAEPLTLDQIYTKAEKEWLLKRDNFKTYFETQNNGLISTCGYVENGCMDDCFVGIHIKSIESL
jgi:hypothetical protein